MLAPSYKTAVELNVSPEVRAALIDFTLEEEVRYFDMAKGWNCVVGYVSRKVYGNHADSFHRDGLRANNPPLATIWGCHQWRDLKTAQEKIAELLITGVVPA